MNYLGVDSSDHGDWSVVLQFDYEAEATYNIYNEYLYGPINDLCFNLAARIVLFAYKNQSHHCPKSVVSDRGDQCVPVTTPD